MPAVRRALDDLLSRAARVGAEQRFRHLIEYAPSAIVVINAEGCIEIVNVRTEKLFDCPRGELFGICSAMLIPDQFDSHYEAFRGETSVTNSVTFEADGQRKDGSTFPAEITLSPLRGQSGTWVSCVIYSVSNS